MASNNNNNVHQGSWSSTNTTPTTTTTIRNPLHLSTSSLMRAYIDSLPDRITIREEISSYQFWKAIRTEFLTSFLFFVFGVGCLVTTIATYDIYNPNTITNQLSSKNVQEKKFPTFLPLLNITTPNNNSSINIATKSKNASNDNKEQLISRLLLANSAASSSSSTSSPPSSFSSTTSIELLISGLAFGLTVACLVQCAGHVSGCHLSIAITLGLTVSGRVSIVRLTGYLLAQCVASILGAAVLVALFGSIPPIQPTIPTTATTMFPHYSSSVSSSSSASVSSAVFSAYVSSQSYSTQATLQATQVFGIEFLATFLVVLTYLANCDPNRIDLGFKALSIGLAYTVAYLFAVSESEER